MSCVVLACGLLLCWLTLCFLIIFSFSRAIGDVSLQPYVTCHPEILEKEIGPEDEYLVLASDGLWVRNFSLLSSPLLSSPLLSSLPFCLPPFLPFLPHFFIPLSSLYDYRVNWNVSWLSDLCFCRMWCTIKMYPGWSLMLRVDPSWHPLESSVRRPWYSAVRTT
jgi:Protein phosphatase 2C